jgi:hypothetical protein
MQSGVAEGRLKACYVLDSGPGVTVCYSYTLRGEVMGEWRKLHSGELHNLYSSPDITRQIKSRRMRWAGHVARMGEGRNVYRVLVGKPERKRPPERPSRRWEDGIKVDLTEIGCWGVEWIHLAQGRDRWLAIVNAVMNLRVLAPRN